jgi:hypothetical protein
MNLKTVLGILAACASGFLGGTLASQGRENRVEAFAPEVIRASRFELVNPAGLQTGKSRPPTRSACDLHQVGETPLRSELFRTDDLFSECVDGTAKPGS